MIPIILHSRLLTIVNVTKIVLVVDIILRNIKVNHCRVLITLIYVNKLISLKFSSGMMESKKKYNIAHN